MIFKTNYRYITNDGKKFGKGVWFDDNGKLVKPGRGFYDRKNKVVR